MPTLYDWFMSSSSGNVTQRQPNRPFPHSPQNVLVTWRIKLLAHLSGGSIGRPSLRVGGESSIGRRARTRVRISTSGRGSSWGGWAPSDDDGQLLLRLLAWLLRWPWLGLHGALAEVVDGCAPRFLGGLVLPLHSGTQVSHAPLKSASERRLRVAALEPLIRRWAHGVFQMPWCAGVTLFACHY